MTFKLSQGIHRNKFHYYISLVVIFTMVLSCKNKEKADELIDQNIHALENSSPKVFQDSALIKKNNVIYAYYSALETGNPAKYRDTKEQLFKIREKTNELISFIETIKLDLVKSTGGRLSDINKPENLTVPDQMMFNKGRAAELKRRLDIYRTEIITLVNDPPTENQISWKLGTDDSKTYQSGTISWEEAWFRNANLEKTLEILTTLQNNIRRAENDLLEYHKTIAHESDLVDQ